MKTIKETKELPVITDCEQMTQEMKEELSDSKGADDHE